MDTVELRIKEGPTKPDLQWAVAYSGRHLHVHFDTLNDAVDARVDTMEEQGDGTRFVLTGHLTSGQYKSWPFRALYDLTERAAFCTRLSRGHPWLKELKHGRGLARQGEGSQLAARA